MSQPAIVITENGEISQNGQALCCLKVNKTTGEIIDTGDQSVRTDMKFENGSVLSTSSNSTLTYEEI